MYLNCHSFHSLRYGTIPLDDLVPLAKENDVKVMALTDINTITGIYNFIKDCEANEIKPVVGIEFRLYNRLLYIGLAKNNNGIAELNKIITKHNSSEEELTDQAPEMQDVFMIYPLEKAPSLLRDYEYIGIRPDQLTKLIQLRWRNHISKMVILQPVTLRNKKEFNLNKILCAVDLNVIGSKLTPGDHAKISDKMIPVHELLLTYRQYPQIIKNTEHVLDCCNFKFDFGVIRNKKTYTDTREGDRILLEKLAFAGLVWRYGRGHAEATTKVENELKIINDLNFAFIYLANWDIVQHSKSCGFMHVGRGSAANSIVSYCLDITAICPIELDLYFERFLNPSRTSAPDFDIDWSWQHRDTMFDYIFERFGKDYVAFCGTIGKFKHRSVVRELGKVFGLPKEELDILSRSRPEHHDKNAVVKLIHDYGTMLEGFPNMRSMHACGIVISEEPLVNFTALEIYPKGYPVMQLDMDMAEDIGFDKFDILSQRGIGTINDCKKLIKTNRGITVNIEDPTLSKDEPTCNEHLKHGKTIGCFYIESPAMRGLLRKLGCDNYVTLVAASSIVRPAVAQGGMMGEYVIRHTKAAKWEYLHPIFEKYLSETYGIMIYQEDVIKIAHHFAGLDLKDADTLRKGKAASKEYQRVCKLFFEYCSQKGYSKELTNEVFKQIQSFAGFSFCKAHSASYAVESYQSLYLKVHYPIEFIVSAINNFGGFYRTEVYVHEAKMAGATVHTSCINKSDYLTNVYGTHVYLGFVHLKALQEDIGKRIPEERILNGDYTSLENFINRIPAGIETIEMLILSGGFRFTSKTKNELILLGRKYFNLAKKKVKNLILFDEPAKNYKLPEITRSPFEDTFDEIEYFNFPVSISPFDLLKTKFRGEIFSRHLPSMHRQYIKMLGYLISIKENPIEGGMMNYGTWIDVEGGYYDSEHFMESLAKYPFRGAGCYLMLGRVNVKFGVPTLTVSRMERLPYIPDPRYEDDKDRSYDIYNKMTADYSATHRGPHPTPDQVGLTRVSME